MRNFVDSEASEHEMLLVQMGANVEQIDGKMCYIRFDISGTPVEYVYNINSYGKYFLERIRPYPLPMKMFEKESDIVELIEIDIKQFKNAVQSKNIDTFIMINNELNRTIKQFEDLFLYYNVPKIKGQKIIKKINQIQNEIIKTKEISQRVFFDKEPENL